MVDWTRGGWTGSLNGWVRKEIQQHFRENTTARRLRYSFTMRILHRIFDARSFWGFVGIYTGFLLAVALAELLGSVWFHHVLPPWLTGDQQKALLTNVASYLITAQVGALGVISIAVGLVTLIGQREGASTDVQVYYHESLAFGIVASSIALLAVLCAQLLWPVQFAMHWLGFGTELLPFKLVLTVAHISWLLLNLSGLAHFVATTLSFVQQSSREQLRERYTTNVVLPVDMRIRLRQQLYGGAGPSIVGEYFPDENFLRRPIVWLGSDMGAGEVEISLTRPARYALHDARMRWIRWVLSRWLKRCRDTMSDQEVVRNAHRLTDAPLLSFPPRLDEPVINATGLCRRRGGTQLGRFERFVLRHAFKFRRLRDEA